MHITRPLPHTNLPTRNPQDPARGALSGQGSAASIQFGTTAFVDGWPAGWQERYGRLLNEIHVKEPFKQHLKGIHNGTTDSAFTLEQVEDLLRDGVQHGGLFYAYQTVFQKMDQPEKLLVAAQVIREYAVNGGNPQYLADFMVENVIIRSMPANALAHHFSLSGEIAAQFNVPEKRNQLRRTMNRLREGGYLSGLQQIGRLNVPAGALPEARPVGFLQAVILTQQLDNAMGELRDSLKDLVITRVLTQSKTLDEAKTLTGKLSALLAESAEIPALKKEVHHLLHEFMSPEIVLVTLDWVKARTQKGDNPETLVSYLTTKPFVVKTEPAALKQELAQLDALLDDASSQKENGEDALPGLMLTAFFEQGKVAAAQKAREFYTAWKAAGLTHPLLNQLTTYASRADNQSKAHPPGEALLTNPDLKAGVLTLAAGKPTAEQFFLALSEMGKFSAAGGDANALARFYTTPRSQITSSPLDLSPSNFLLYMGPITTQFQQLSQEVQKRDFQKALPLAWFYTKLYGPDAVLKHINYVIQMKDALPASLPDERKWALLETLGNSRSWSQNEQSYTEKLTALFRDLTDKPEIGEAVLQELQRSSDLEQATRKKELLLSMADLRDIPSELLDKLFKIYNEQRQTVMLKILTQYVQNGGQAEPFIRFFTEPSQVSGWRAPYSIETDYLNYFQDLGTLIKQCETPQQRNAFDQALSRLYYGVANPGIYFKHFPRFVLAAARMFAALPTSLSEETRWQVILKDFATKNVNRDKESILFATLDSSARFTQLFDGLDDKPEICQQLAQRLIQTPGLFDRLMLVKQWLLDPGPVGGVQELDRSTEQKLRERLDRSHFQKALEICDLYALKGGNPNDLAQFLNSYEQNRKRPPSESSLDQFSELTKLADSVGKYETPAKRAVFDHAISAAWYQIDWSHTSNITRLAETLTNMALALPESMPEPERLTVASMLLKNSGRSTQIPDFSSDINQLFTGLEGAPDKTREIFEILLSSGDLQLAKSVKTSLMGEGAPLAYLSTPAVLALMKQKLGSGDRFNNVLSLAKAYEQNGGNPQHIVDLFTKPVRSDYTQPSAIEPSYISHFNDLADRVRRYKTPEQQAVFATSFGKIYNAFGPTFRYFGGWCEAATDMMLSLPESLDEPARWESVIEYLNDQYDYGNKQFKPSIDVSAKLKQSFDPGTTPPEMAQVLLKRFKTNRDADRLLTDKEVLKTLKAQGVPAEQWIDKLAVLERQRETFKRVIPQGDQLTAVLPEVVKLSAEQSEEVIQLIDWAQRNQRLDLRTFQPRQLVEAIKLWSQTATPDKFLDTVVLSQGTLHPRALSALYSYIEHTDAGKKLGKRVMPELMASIIPYLDMAAEARVNTQDFGAQAIRALSSLSGMKMTTIEPVEFDNYARIGTMGLSFPKWKYDAMKRWRGQAQMERPPLFEDSKLLQLSPKRTDDKKFHGGFQLYNKDTGVSIEMRRGYIVISKPGLGTLVVRNSGLAFGRDLLEQPAYYHPTRTYTSGYDMFYPDEDLNEAYRGETFYPIFTDRLQQSSQKVAFHQKIQALLNEFDTTMAPYLGWKQGFTGGKASHGFKEILQASLYSALNQGAETPFGNKTHVRMAWVNTHGLPYPVKSFDVSNAMHQAEMMFYNQVLNGEIVVSDPMEYRQQMPNLLEFITYGLENKLELILVD